MSYQIKYIVYSFILCNLLLFSCTKKPESRISIELENDFPVITLKNSRNNILTIKPENNTCGGIGYFVDSSVYWLKGYPELTESSETQLTYTWELNNNDKVNLVITPINNDINFKLSVNENSKVSGWIIKIQSVKNEYFTGVVDGKPKQSPDDNSTTAINLRGQKMDVKLNPTVSAYAPFYISSANYGIFVKGTWPGMIDFCKENENFVKIEFKGGNFDFKVYSANNPLDIVRRHALETGPSIVPPAWAFGPWRWRDQHYNKRHYFDNTIKKTPFNTDIVEDVLMMEAMDIPATAHLIDKPWSCGNRGFDDYNFDTLEFPNPEGMIQWLNSKNLELMMCIDPFLNGGLADYAEEHNYNLKNKTLFNSRQVLMDFTNLKAVKWWGENGPGKLAKMGIKGFKLDKADGEKLADSLHYLTHKGTSYRENYNDYPRQYVKATYDAIQPVLTDNFVLYPRAQYTGSAKYGATWAGDTDGKPEGLRSAIIGMQRCAVLGYPIWGSDIGGYWGKFSRETTMRWLAFGCFSPIMETGATNNLGFWSNPTEPYYDIELIATWRLYSKIRMKLIQYLREQAKVAHETGTPIAMPLFLMYPKQEKAWEDWQTYLLGPDILVSVVWKKNQNDHKIYLPKGETWIDAWTKKEHLGGQYLTVETPLYKIPVFIREGSGIDLGNLNELYSESIKIASSKPDLTELEQKEDWK